MNNAISKRWSLWNASAERNSGTILILEVICSLVIIGSAMPFLAQFVKAMATTSLWYDEIYTIMHFSSRGIIRTLTDYHVPNNHIFFNLLNTITPGAQSYDPLRARLWSFIFMAACIIAPVGMFFRRRQFLEGALFFMVVALNKPLLDLTLQARGYGFLAFCAASISVLLMQYCREPRRWRLVLMSLLTVLGTWTVPTFGLFSGPLLLILFLWTRDKKVFIAGVITLLAMIGVYAPVWKNIFYHMNTYAVLSHAGSQYTSVDSVFETIRRYILHPAFFGAELTKDWAVFTFLMGIVIIPTLIWKQEDDTGRGVRILTISSMVFLTGCLKMGTPKIITTNFIMFPLVLCALYMFGRILRYSGIRAIRPVVYIGFAVLFSVQGIHQARHFHFGPRENWMGVARYIQRTYPEGMEVYATFRRDFYRAFVNNDYLITDTFDAEKFSNGQLICVDSYYQRKTRFQPEQFIPAGVAVPIFQRGGAFHKVCVAPAPESEIDRIVMEDGRQLGNEMYDRDILTGWSTNEPQSELNTPVTLRVFLKPGVRYRSLYIVSRNQELPVKFQIHLGIEGRRERMQRDFITVHGDVIVLALRDRAVEYIDFEVSPAEMGKFFSINEMWAYPEKY